MTRLSMNSNPVLWVFGGPNGAGKSTLVAKIKLDSLGPLINPDNIAAELNPNNRDDPTTVIRAGQKAIEQRTKLFNNKQSFAIETTLSGHSAIKLIRQAKEQGYSVNLVYVGIINAQLSNARVYTRIKQKGHDVPEDAIQRRYQQTLNNLMKAAPIVDKLYIFDNSGKYRRLLLHMNGAKLLSYDNRLPAWALEYVPQIKALRENL